MEKAKEIERLANSIRHQNEAGTKIAKIINRPAERSHAGEYIASIIFEIELNQSASYKGIDGHFNGGNLIGKTVNIKWYGKCDNTLNVNLERGPDYYLVMTGPKNAPSSSKGSTSPWLISYVFLFDSNSLLRELAHVKVGIATSVRKQLWEMAEIYPTQRNEQLILSIEQRNLLRLLPSLTENE